MGLIDLYGDLRRDAEALEKGAATKDGSAKETWVRAAAAALIIASRKTAKARMRTWTREAVECMASADPDSEEVLEDFLWYSPQRSFEEVWDFFQGLYGDPYEIAPTS